MAKYKKREHKLLPAIDRELIAKILDEPPQGAEYVIWSTRHQGYIGQYPGSGYPLNPLYANVFDLDRALEITGGPEKEAARYPNIVVPKKLADDLFSAAWRGLRKGAH